MRRHEERRVNVARTAARSTRAPSWPTTSAGESGRPATPLQRQLAEPERQRPQPIDALRLARRTILDARRLDMQALAAELGVNRVTLYRWVGSRNDLLVEVLWSMTRWRFNAIWTALSDQPGPRVPEGLRQWIAITVDSPGIRAFLYGESELAMRLLTLDSGGFQPRLLALIRERIVADIDEGRIDSPLPIDELAYAVLRICESYIYLPVISGQPTDPEKAYRVLAVLMPPATPTTSAALLEQSAQARPRRSPRRRNP
jgi:AcrR family transcriptional regulator